MFKNKNVIVIIPARSGSKSIRNKNIRKFKGKPLIYHTIEYAIKSKIIDEVVVTTDSQKYINLIKKYKLNFSVKRSKQLSGDYVQDFPVIKDALHKSENFFKKNFDYIILLRPTSPLRNANLIKESLNILHKHKKSHSVRAVQKAKQHPYRQWKYDRKKNFIISATKGIYEPYNLPRQKLPNSFFQTGDIETVKRSTIINGSISGKNVLPIFIRKKYYDIDNLDDFKQFQK
jgi:CMP-N,N'-diacetyllegionaminic acid synthase